MLFLCVLSQPGTMQLWERGKRREKGKAARSKVKHKMCPKHCVFFPEDIEFYKSKELFVCAFTFLILHTPL